MRTLLGVLVFSMIIFSLPGGGQCECDPDGFDEFCCHPIPPYSEEIIP